LWRWRGAIDGEFRDIVQSLRQVSDLSIAISSGWLTAGCAALRWCAQKTKGCATLCDWAYRKMEVQPDAQTPVAPLSQQIVLEAISAAVGLDNAARSAAESALTTWEKDAAPGFIASLVQIVQQTDTAPQPARLLAAIVAKNAVGSSWRKTMGTKEWSRVPDDEKVFIRGAVEGMLLSDPSDQIALQLTLLIANMAQFDFPSGWPHLLSALVGAAAWEQPASSPAAKIRAMRTVKHVVAVLAAKRPSINTLEQAAAGPQLQTLVAARVEELRQ
jgi:hypothetical protein